MKENIVELGDQSPWCGGLNRLEALQGPFSPWYLVHDIDAPWRMNGDLEITIRRGWSDYWSVATRHPWAPQIPGVCCTKIHDVLNSPRGLSYLYGPRTTETIYSLRHNRHFLELITEILKEEWSWANMLRQLLGKESVESPWEGAALPASFSGFVKYFTTQPFGSAYEFFRESRPYLYQELPPELFWYLDPQGQRYAWGQLPGELSPEQCVIVPKGSIAPLEDIARGITPSCTACPYLDEVIRVRDTYLPGVSLKMLYVKFNWIIEPDPLILLQEEATRRRERSLTFSPNDVAALRGYWSGRPTSISYHLLGGNLNPSFDLQTY